MGAAVFFSTLAALGVAGCFGLGLVAPLVHGLRLLRAKLMQALGPGHAMLQRPLHLSTLPWRPGLTLAHRRFAADTRALLADLEHARAHSHRFSDDPCESWWQQLAGSMSESAYASTIGITGEAWRWLRQAEELLGEDNEPAGAELATVTTATRSVLFDARPVSERLEVLARLVSRVDDGLRAQAGAPYRDRLTRPPRSTPCSPATAAPAVVGTQQQQRYDEVLKSCDGAIAKIVRRFADSPEHDDLLQEIRLAIWNALPAYRGDCPLRAYVLRIAKYRAISFKERRVVLEGEREWPDGAPSPDEFLEQSRQHKALRGAIRRLPDKLRVALEMRLKGFSYREIAERLALTEKNASVRVSRARNAVKRKLCPGTT